MVAFEKENLKLKDEIDRTERQLMEKTAALMQAGHKTSNVTSSMLGGNNSGPTFVSVVSTQFSTFESRIRSFRGWPHSAAMRPLATPAALASQGFYFSPDDHYKDRVLCSFCNLELADWGPKDDPIREHSVRSSQCPVVTGVVLAMQARDPSQLEEIIAEEEAAVAKLQVRVREFPFAHAGARAR